MLCLTRAQQMSFGGIGTCGQDKMVAEKVKGVWQEKFSPETQPVGHVDNSQQLWPTMIQPGMSSRNMIQKRLWVFVLIAIKRAYTRLLSRMESYGESKGSRRVRASG